MTFESKAKTIKQLAAAMKLLQNGVDVDDFSNSRWIKLEEAQKEIKRVQDVNFKYADLFEKREEELKTQFYAQVRKVQELEAKIEALKREAFAVGEQLTAVTGWNNELGAKIEAAKQIVEDEELWNHHEPEVRQLLRNALLIPRNREQSTETKGGCGLSLGAVSHDQPHTILCGITL